LHANQLAGFKFRRQHPIGQFIIDFCCEEVRLVVELDGDTYVEKEAYDATRSAQLAALGYHVMRISNRDALNNTDAVLEMIFSECEKRRA
jgi:very-short-patch-repair endonuclease